MRASSAQFCEHAVAGGDDNCGQTGVGGWGLVVTRRCLPRVPRTAAEQHATASELSLPARQSSADTLTIYQVSGRRVGRARQRVGTVWLYARPADG